MEKNIEEEEKETPKEVEEEVVETKEQLEDNFNDVWTEIPNDKEEKETPKTQFFLNDEKVKEEENSYPIISQLEEEKEKPTEKIEEIQENEKLNRIASIKNDIRDFHEYIKIENLKIISRRKTFSFDDFHKMYRSYDIEIPLQEGYFHITELCGVNMAYLEDRTNYAICKGVRKTNEKIKLIKKNTRTNEILLEHEFDVYETADKHIYKKFIVYHGLLDDIKRIRLLGKRKKGYKNVEIDEETKEPYVLTINKNKYGNITVIRNHQYCEKYAEKIEENVFPSI